MAEQDKKAIDVSGDGGVLKEIYQEGTGEVPPVGDEVRGAFCGHLALNWLRRRRGG
jgi:hypothetical protein